MSCEKEPLVSVITPTYKRSEMLTRAIDSVLNQSYKNIEIIVVDDNDPENEWRKHTENRMKAYAEDPRVQYVKHMHNMNGAAARNTGIQKSKGEYVAFLDDDDWFYPQKIEKQMDFMLSHKEFAGVYCGLRTKKKTITQSLQGDLSKYILLNIFSPQTSTLLFRKTAIVDIGGFDTSFRRHQDYELLLKFFSRYTIGAIPEVLAEMGTNDGANGLHGEALENMKRHYIDNFQNTIERLSIDDGNFKQKVYATHCAQIVCDHLGELDIGRAWRVYKVGLRISAIRVNHLVIKHIFKYLQIKVFHSHK